MVGNIEAAISTNPNQSSTANKVTKKVVRRFIDSQLFDVLPDGTAIPIEIAAPPRKIPMLIMRELVSVESVVEQFMTQLVLPFASIGSIVLPPSNIPDVSIGEGVPVPVPLSGMPTPPNNGAGTVASSPISLPGGPIFTQFGVVPDVLASAIQEFWPQDQWKNAAEVSHGESGWRNDAINDTVSIYGPCGTRYFISRLGIWAQTEVSVGYFQINICAHGGTIAMWEDHRNNCRKGAELYHSAGNKYTPWLYTATQLGLPT